MKDINFYKDMESWLSEKPEVVIRGQVKNKGESYIEITDENGFTQIINLNKIFAVVF